MREGALARRNRFVEEGDAGDQRGDHGGGQWAVGRYPRQQQLAVGRQLLDPRGAVGVHLLLRVGQQPRRVQVADQQPQSAHHCRKEIQVFSLRSCPFVFSRKYEAVSKQRDTFKVEGVLRGHSRSSEPLPASF